MRSAPLISVVDDDPAVAEAVVSLMESVGRPALRFGSAEDFLDSARLTRTACLILDVRMPGMGGLELQRRLAANSNPTPIVFITAHGDTDAEKEALRLGAVAFLFKPFSQESLLEAVRSAVGGEDRMQMVNAAPVPLDLSALVERIRSEYREMPGLSLSPDQARRLWGLDERTCGEVLAALVESGFLRRTPKGAFVKTA